MSPMACCILCAAYAAPSSAGHCILAAHAHLLPSALKRQDRIFGVSAESALCERCASQPFGSSRSSLGPGCTKLSCLCLAGIDDFHDGVNYTRTACVIAVSKARDLFEPFLHQVGRAWL